MATNVYGNGTNSTAGVNTVTHYYDRAGIKAATAVKVYGQFADRRSMKNKMGRIFKTSKFLKMYDRNPQSHPDFNAFGYMSNRIVQEVNDDLTNNVALAEGAQDVNKRSLHKITVEQTLARYGEMMDYTDEVELFSEDYIQTRYREELGDLANVRVEDLIQLDMLSTGTVLRPGSAANDSLLGATQASGADDADYRVSYDLIRKASRKLVRNRAKKTTSVVTGSTKVDTRTVDRAFYAIVSADVKADLEVLTRGGGGAEEFAFIPARKYASASNIAEGEVGAMHEVRFIEAESAMRYNTGAVPPQNYVGELAIIGATDLTSANPADRGNFAVYPILFPTPGAFATVGLQGRNKITFHSSTPNNVTNQNAFGTTGMFSYNFFYAGIILEEEKLLKVTVCASA